MALVNRPDVVIDVAAFDAFLFDLDGVITRTAELHAAAWKQLFDEHLAAHAARTGTLVGVGDGQHAARLREHGAHVVVADLGAIRLEPRAKAAS